MEHGQRPEVARAAVGRQAPKVDRVREGLDVGAPVVHDDALGPARRARRVVERERVPLVLGLGPRRRRVAALYQRLVAVGAAADENGLNVQPVLLEAQAPPTASTAVGAQVVHVPDSAQSPAQLLPPA